MGSDPVMHAPRHAVDLDGELLAAMLSDEPLVYAMLEPPGEPPTPGEAAVDGETGTGTEVENVEVTFLRLVLGERRPGQRSLEVPEDHGSLTDGEDTELGKRLPAEGHAVAPAEETPVAIPE